MQKTKPIAMPKTSQTNYTTENIKHSPVTSCVPASDAAGAEITNCFALAPNDVWLHLIGPQLSARDIVALSMVCRWANDIAHEMPVHSGVYELRDCSVELGRVREAVLCWPNILIRYVYSRSSVVARNTLLALGKVHSLVLAGCTQPPSLDFLSHARLRDLALTDVVLSQGACELLAQGLGTNKSITSLEISQCRFEDQGVGLGMGLGANKSISSLKLSEMTISGQALGGMLIANTTITHLALTSNSYGEDGKKALLQGLGANTAIVRLYLGYNIIGAEGAEALGSMLQANKHITEIDLERNRLCDAGAGHVFEALRANTTLTALGLSGNILWAESGKKFATLLDFNRTLRKIDLSSNSLGPEGTSHICQALACNSSVTSLLLQGNNIGPEGARSVSGMLGVNNTLQSLDLSNNHIGPSGARVVAQALRTNTALQHLLLGSNGLRDEGGLSIIHSLDTCCASLTDLDLTGNGIQPKIIENILDMTRTRTKSN